MKVLVVGGGGREHALVERSRARRRRRGVVRARATPASRATRGACELPRRTTWRRSSQLGVARARRPRGRRARRRRSSTGSSTAARRARRRRSGPARAAARLEGSKAFAKEFMRAARRADRGYASASTDFEDGARVRAGGGAAVVVKADGLAAGKGVVVRRRRHRRVDALRDGCSTSASAPPARASCSRSASGAGAVACSRSCAASDVRRARARRATTSARTTATAGPNTGGMGACAAPVPDASTRAARRGRARRAATGASRARAPRHAYRGVLYAGLMLDGRRAAGARVQRALRRPRGAGVLPRLRGDVARLLRAGARRAGGCACARVGRASRSAWSWRPRATRRRRATGDAIGLDDGRATRSSSTPGHAARCGAARWYRGRARRDGHGVRRDVDAARAAATRRGLRVRFDEAPVPQRHRRDARHGRRSVAADPRRCTLPGSGVERDAWRHAGPQSRGERAVRGAPTDGRILVYLSETRAGFREPNLRVGESRPTVKRVAGAYLRAPHSDSAPTGDAPVPETPTRTKEHHHGQDHRHRPRHDQPLHGCLRGTEPTVIPNAEGARTTPSVVAFTKTGERLVGAAPSARP